MGKTLKKIVMVLCIVFIIFAVSKNNTIAKENSDKRIAVHVNIPEEWGQVFMWAWEDGGENVFSAWPGEAFESLSDNEGWYYIWLPTWATHAKISAKDIEAEAEFDLQGKNIWVTVKENNEIEISTDPLTTGETPEFVEKYPAHIKLDASWENPVIKSEDGAVVISLKDVEDGWYDTKIPTSVKKLVISANDGTDQTENFRVDVAEIWITVEKDGTVDYSYKDPNAEEIPNIVVHAQTPDDWENPCIWAWSAPDGTNAFTSWPGENLEEKDGWYIKEVPGWINSVIINGNKGKVQTTDISVEVGKDIWLVVIDSENYEVSYESPDGLEEESTSEEIKETEENTTADVETEKATESKKETSKEKNSKVVIPIIVIVVVCVGAVATICIKKKK